MPHYYEIADAVQAREDARLAAEAAEARRMERHRDLCTLALDWTEAAIDAAVRAGHRVNERDRNDCMVRFDRSGDRAMKRVADVVRAWNERAAQARLAPGDDGGHGGFE
jgi:hypothetical protein